MARHIKDAEAGRPLGGLRREYTRKDKAVNWWDYHKWWVYGGVIALILVGWMVHDLFFQAKPDYYVSYVVRQELPDETAYRLERALEELCGDRNGDGRVLVQVDQYILTFDEQDTALNDYYMTNSINQMLVSVANSEGSCIYILEDPAGFQAKTGALQYLDGTLPPDGAEDWENMVCRWSDCPGAASLELGTYFSSDSDSPDGLCPSQELFECLYIGRRAAFDTQQRENCAAYDELWQALTTGALEQ